MDKNPYDELGALVAACGGNEEDLLRAKDLLLKNRVAAFRDGFNEGKAKGMKQAPWWVYVLIGFITAAMIDIAMYLGGWM